MELYFYQWSMAAIDGARSLTELGWYRRSLPASSLPLNWSSSSWSIFFFPYNAAHNHHHQNRSIPIHLYDASKPSLTSWKLVLWLIISATQVKILLPNIPRHGPKFKYNLWSREWKSFGALEDVQKNSNTVNKTVNARQYICWSETRYVYFISHNKDIPN